jgi:hypothetical protein
LQFGEECEVWLATIESILYVKMFESGHELEIVFVTGFLLIATVSNHSLTASVVAVLYHTSSIWRVYMLWISGQWVRNWCGHLPPIGRVCNKASVEFLGSCIQEWRILSVISRCRRVSTCQPGQPTYKSLFFGSRRNSSIFVSVRARSVSSQAVLQCWLRDTFRYRIRSNRLVFTWHIFQDSFLHHSLSIYVHATWSRVWAAGRPRMNGAEAQPRGE